jgi:hypothetical protein
MQDVAGRCFACAPQVDRLAVSYNNYGTCRVRTLGQRFTSEQIAKLSEYKPVGLLWEFEEIGEVYGRCGYDFENDHGVAVMAGA